MSDDELCQIVGCDEFALPYALIIDFGGSAVAFRLCRAHEREHVGGVKPESDDETSETAA